MAGRVCTLSRHDRKRPRYRRRLAAPGLSQKGRPQRISRTRVVRGGAYRKWGGRVTADPDRTPAPTRSSCPDAHWCPAVNRGTSSRRRRPQGRRARCRSTRARQSCQPPGLDPGSTSRDPWPVHPGLDRVVARNALVRTAGMRVTVLEQVGADVFGWQVVPHRQTGLEQQHRPPGFGKQDTAMAHPDVPRAGENVDPAPGRSRAAALPGCCRQPYARRTRHGCDAASPRSRAGAPGRLAWR